MTSEPWIDAHVHVTRPSAVPGLLAAMEATHAAAAVIFGLQHAPGSQLHDQTVYAAAQQVPDRLWPAICGFNPVDPTAPAYVERLLAQGGWRGIGEYLVGHGGARRVFPPETSWRHPVVQAVLRLAAEARVPALVHCDPSWQDELSETIRAHPRTTFVWVHVGYDFAFATGQGPREPSWAGALLDRLPNLYFELSTWRQSPSFYAEDGWQALFERHAERFLLGLDTTGDYPNQIAARRRAFAAALEALDARIRRALLYENARRLFSPTARTGAG